MSSKHFSNSYEMFLSWYKAVPILVLNHYMHSFTTLIVFLWFFSWVQLGQKPSKLPDGRCRGELEVRLTFHVKSRNDDSSSTSSLKGKRAGSIKSLVTAVGKKSGCYMFYLSVHYYNNTVLLFMKLVLLISKLTLW